MAKIPTFERNWRTPGRQKRTERSGIVFGGPGRGHRLLLHMRKEIFGFRSWIFLPHGITHMISFFVYE